LSNNALIVRMTAVQWVCCIAHTERERRYHSPPPRRRRRKRREK
jgi:hypothetical protein